jgi:hypothetical protein
LNTKITSHQDHGVEQFVALQGANVAGAFSGFDRLQLRRCGQRVRALSAGFDAAPFLQAPGRSKDFGTRSE